MEQRCFSVRRLVPKTWHTDEGSRLMSSILRQRLRDRCRGKRWKMITLTYDREGFEHPRDVYETAKRERHTARFIERLGELCGMSFAGKWICKMEFQSGGWLHWHILLEHGPKIDWRTILKAWNRGRVDIRHGTRRRIDYLAKYVAKPSEGMPGWLLGEPSRSVRVIRASSGFWANESKKSKQRIERMSWPMYETIGQAATRRRAEMSLINCGGFFMSCKVGIAKVASILRNAGFATATCTNSGSLLVQGSLARAVDLVKAAAEAAKPCDSTAAASAFFLSRTPEPPPASRPDTWLLEFWESMHLAGWQIERRSEWRQAA